MTFSALRLSLLLLASLGGLLAAADPLEFLHVTDTHVIDARGVHPSIAAQRRHLHSAAANLQSFFDTLSAQPPAFVLVTGDLIDGVSFQGAEGDTRAGQIELFAKMIARGPVPVYLALGNHDVQRYTVDAAASKPAGSDASAAADRAAWRAAAPCFRDGTYYAFQRRAGSTTYRFLVLDNGSLKDRSFAEAQWRWLEKQVRQAGDDPLIVALHIPLDQSPASAPIREILARAPNVALVLAGHKHSNAIEEISLGDHGVTQVRTAIFATNPASVRAIRLFEDRIEIGATGRRGSTEHTVALHAVPALAH